MPVTLQDPTLSRDPSTRRAIRDRTTLRAPRPLAEELLAAFCADGATTFTFELASHGGYARTLTGTIDYVDDEAQTLMVLSEEGTIVRVPLRDVTSARTRRRIAPGARRSTDAQGLGTDRAAVTL